MQVARPKDLPQPASTYEHSAHSRSRICGFCTPRSASWRWDHGMTIASFSYILYLPWQVMRFQQSSQGADKALNRDLQLPPGSFPAARCVGRDGSIGMQVLLPPVGPA